MWNGDVIRHNFKWNICDVKKRKDLKECNVDILYENRLVLKNKQVSTFLSENLISMKSRSREIFG